MNASFPLRALHISGLDPWDNSWFAKLRSFLTFITAFIVCITSIIEMITIEWHVDAIVPAVEAFVGSAQVNIFIKQSIFIFTSSFNFRAF